MNTDYYFSNLYRIYCWNNFPVKYLKLDNSSLTVTQVIKYSEDWKLKNNELKNSGSFKKENTISRFLRVVGEQLLILYSLICRYPADRSASIEISANEHALSSERRDDEPSSSIR